MEKKSWTAAELLQLSGGYWSACALHAGVKLDVFSTLAEKAHTGAQLAGRLGTDERGLTMLLNALAALELIEKHGESYGATPFAAEFLSRQSPQYLGHIILHHHYLMPGWSRLDGAVRSGFPDRERTEKSFEPEQRESFEMGMFDLAMLIGPKVAAAIDLAGRRRLLDLGGGPGTYAVHFCLKNPELSAVDYDLPSTRPFAERTIARFGLGNRITFCAGDFMTDDLPGRFDVAWLSHILHGCGPDACAVILRKSASVLEPGGLIMVQEFILDDTMDAPLHPALFALNMLLGTPEGRSYSQGELYAMLESAGARNLRRIHLELPNGAGVIAGNMP
ncbi:MAG TPA: methyltransferase [Geobacteraceae bacterium]|nr:methyltransferase [Geobacteraceae bacterium]